MTAQLPSISRFLSCLSAGLVAFLVVFNLTPYLLNAHNDLITPRLRPSRLPTTTHVFKHLRQLKDLGPAGDKLWNSAVLPKQGGFLWVRTNSTTGDGMDREGWGITMFHALHCLQMMREVFKMAVPPDYDEDHAYTSRLTSESGSHSHDMDPKHATHCFSYLYQVITCGADGTLEPPQRQFDAEGRETSWVVNGAGFQHTCRDPRLLWNVVEKGERIPHAQMPWKQGDTVWDTFS